MIEAPPPHERPIFHCLVAFLDSKIGPVNTLASTRTVVIAEDDPGHARLIIKNLRKQGVAGEILHFQDGQELIDFFVHRKNPPGKSMGDPLVLILDIRMPKVDGHQVLRRLNADPDLRRIPVIVFTTSDNPVDRIQCLEEGCQYFIKKPTNYDSFVDAVREIKQTIETISA